MITGYNTDIEYDGVVYHVQTEDKGLDSPIVLSLVYTGGAILAAKRASYADLIAAGFQEAALAERLKRQHRLICAAIHAGRIEELKQLSKGQTGRLVTEHLAVMNQASAPPADSIVPPVAVIETEPAPAVPMQHEAPTGPLTTPVPPPAEAIAPPPEAFPAPPANRATGPLTMAGRSEAELLGMTTAEHSAYTVHDQRRRSKLGEFSEPDGLRITLLGHDPHFNGGEEIQLKAIVTRIADNVEEPLGGAMISIKILGTTFRPVLFSVKTDREGVMSVATRIPAFTSGRAAIVVRATASDLATEARWVVHPGK